MERTIVEDKDTSPMAGSTSLEKICQVTLRQHILCTTYMISVANGDPLILAVVSAHCRQTIEENRNKGSLFARRSKLFFSSPL